MLFTGQLSSSAKLFLEGSKIFWLNIQKIEKHLEITTNDYNDVTITRPMIVCKLIVLLDALQVLHLGILLLVFFFLTFGNDTLTMYIL